MKKLSDYGREWLDTLVVAISVAMCFRAYFYEPFNIPTGSMQPTLWGNHSIECDSRTAWDKAPLSALKWLWTGEKYVEYAADAAGYAKAYPRNDGFADIRIGLSSKIFKLPTDAAAKLSGRYFEKGEKVWAGYVVVGDFIFVNRWKWNFVKPQVDDVMIFSTTGIAQLQQGTHYIKRLKALPGQTYRLEHPVSGGSDVVTMRDDQYFACGDNYKNSFDSRYFGPVPVENLRGIGSVVFWPFKGWRIIR